MNQTHSLTDHKSGFVAILGPPNAGKSTLLNHYLGLKLSITSQKPQTTRNRILGVVHQTAAQLVFIDTPGIHQSKVLLNRKLLESALSAIGDADVILLMVDGTRAQAQAEKIMLKALGKTRTPVLLAINKVDQVAKPDLLPLIENWSQRFPFAETIPISALHGIQTEELLDTIVSLLPPGPAYFPDDTLTDVPEKFIVAEIIREKIFRLTGQEIPYSTAVTIESFKENNKTGLIRINGLIHVERSSQKGIIIGQKGAMLKKIGSDARVDIERLLQARIFLELFVRIEKNWSRDPRALRRLGY